MTSYDSATWKSIAAFSSKVEESLKKSGLLLTMGGEPTFVPLKPEGSEWATTAHGPTKLDYARRFACQLIEEFYPGATLLMTYGKQYPGEPLPRWALLIQWLKEGSAAWKNSKLIRKDTQMGSHTLADAEKFISAFAQKIGISSNHIYYGLEQAETQSLSGLVLPLDNIDGAWIGDDWTAAVELEKTADKKCLSLFPGDSLIGLRLPLHKLAENTRRRAFTAEIREGTLTLFIPPLALDSYVQLLPLIETTLEQTHLKDIVLSGYAPPADPRLSVIGLASDPGVIEINLAVCNTWAEYDTQIHNLYTAAKKVGLCARKLQFNGRETGTGGGAHIVFGGPIGLTSPFFAFPALLPSIIRYWQHHPALSYVFTGQYMGPSSQAPRIDESTFEALYELEIACEGAERLGNPWNLPLFDLLFRDLLMDRTGNTHRAEISVDKLWNPFSPSGQLGLIEFRAFETNPSVTELSVTALFLRAIIARLGTAPFKSPFVRWNGELHDKHFSPTFLWQDLLAICHDLKSHNITFEADWLKPLFEFRFPILGEFQLAPVQSQKDSKRGTVVFRQALEAWPLLGEQPTSGGATVRSVDASLDRIEAAISSAELLEAGVLLINGLPCEFRVEPSTGKAACGIRFRAFFLVPGLHPHVPVHAPLLIEWVDKKSLSVLAAARWHTWNPRGVPYADRPAHEEAAKARFSERWEPWPHTIGQPRFIPSIDFPPEGRYTLDLRRYPAQLKF